MDNCNTGIILLQVSLTLYFKEKSTLMEVTRGKPKRYQEHTFSCCYEVPATSKITCRRRIGVFHLE
uniref:Uncharacterized protein n=1 Tax=Anguilla anguilla TaxID=7936 RepID=A0A0E9WMR6_ANGAN